MPGEQNATYVPLTKLNIYYYLRGKILLFKINPARFSVKLNDRLVILNTKKRRDILPAASYYF